MDRLPHKSLILLVGAGEFELQIPTVSIRERAAHDA